MSLLKSTNVKLILQWHFQECHYLLFMISWSYNDTFKAPLFVVHRTMMLPKTPLFQNAIVSPYKAPRIYERQ